MPILARRVPVCYVIFYMFNRSFNQDILQGRHPSSRSSYARTFDSLFIKLSELSGLCSDLNEKTWSY